MFESETYNEDDIVAIPLKQGLIFNVIVNNGICKASGRNPFEAGTNF